MTRAPSIIPYRQYDPNLESAISNWDPHKEADHGLCMAAFQTLVKHFPGHFWRVRADSKQGIAQIQINQLMGDTLWWNIRLDETANHNDFRLAVMRGGGEILERYGLARSGMDVDKFLEARAMTPNRPGIKDPIPEGDLRVFNSAVKPAAQVEGTGENMSYATPPEADAA